MADTSITFSDNQHATVPATGTCPECWGTVPLTPDGLIDRHPERVIKGGIEDNGERMCDGRGQRPRQVA